MLQNFQTTISPSQRLYLCNDSKDLYIGQVIIMTTNYWQCTMEKNFGTLKTRVPDTRKHFRG